MVLYGPLAIWDSGKSSCSILNYVYGDDYVEQLNYNVRKLTASNIAFALTKFKSLAEILNKY